MSTERIYLRESPLKTMEAKIVFILTMKISFQVRSNLFKLSQQLSRLCLFKKKRKQNNYSKSLLHAAIAGVCSLFLKTSFVYSLHSYLIASKHLFSLMIPAFYFYFINVFIGEKVENIHTKKKMTVITFWLY